MFYFDKAHVLTFFLILIASIQKTGFLVVGYTMFTYVWLKNCRKSQSVLKSDV